MAPHTMRLLAVLVFCAALLATRASPADNTRGLVPGDPDAHHIVRSAIHLQPHAMSVTRVTAIPQKKQQAVIRDTVNSFGSKLHLTDEDYMKIWKVHQGLHLGGMKPFEIFRAMGGLGFARP